MRTRRLTRTCLLSLTLLLALACTARAQATGEATEKPIPPLPYKAVEGRPSAAGWKRFQFGEPSLFSLIMPQPPQGSGSHVMGSDGGLTFWTYISDSTSARYGVQYTVYDDNGPAHWTEEQKRKAYENFAGGFLRGLLEGAQAAEGESVRVLAERRIRTDDVDGFEREFAFRDFQGRLQLFQLGRRAVALFSIWPSAVKSEAERADFFKSIKFESARRSQQETAATQPITSAKRSAANP